MRLRLLLLASAIRTGFNFGVLPTNRIEGKVDVTVEKAQADEIPSVCDCAAKRWYCNLNRECSGPACELMDVPQNKAEPSPQNWPLSVNRCFHDCFRKAEYMNDEAADQRYKGDAPLLDDGCRAVSTNWITLACSRFLPYQLQNFHPRTRYGAFTNGEGRSEYALNLTRYGYTDNKILVNKNVFEDSTYNNLERIDDLDYSGSFDPDDERIRSPLFKRPLCSWALASQSSSVDDGLCQSGNLLPNADYQDCREVPTSDCIFGKWYVAKADNTRSYCQPRAHNRREICDQDVGADVTCVPPSPLPSQPPSLPSPPAPPPSPSSPPARPLASPACDVFDGRIKVSNCKSKKQCGAPSCACYDTWKNDDDELMAKPCYYEASNSRCNAWGSGALPTVNTVTEYCVLS